MLGTGFAGKPARIISLRKKGRPHPTMPAALGIGLGPVPALMVYQAAVARGARAGGAG